MSYTYPAGFDKNRALELGALINEAYAQRDRGAAWVPPAAYGNIIPFFSAEPGAKIGPLPVPTLGAAPRLPFGFVATQGTDVYVVIRGTITPLEWLEDAYIQPALFSAAHAAWGQVTRGFKIIHDAIFPQILAALTQLKAAGNPLASIYVTGHSLGAALAHLCAADLFLHLGLQPIAYTFSGPRAGDPGFASAYAAAGLPTWRIFNTEDLVPTVPAAAVKLGAQITNPFSVSLSSLVIPQFTKIFPIGYAHLGYPIPVTFHKDTLADNHNLTNTFNAL